MKVAIHQNHDIFNHSTTWDTEWITFCKKNEIDFEIVNCFDSNILEILKNFDILLWHFSHYSLQEMTFARTIINAAKMMGLMVFPNYNTSWHFDDKIAETYLLKTIAAPIPESWMFYTKESATEFFNKHCKYPIVAKLKSGSGSSNVKLLKNRKTAIKYTIKMFNKGFKTAPSIMFKTKSNVLSSRNLNTIIKRAKRIPDFIQSFAKSKQLPDERGYVFVQEFVPNDGYDLKVVIVGEKASFLARDVRTGDFRASGGGVIRYEKSYINKKILDIAFDISNRLEFQCMGYDFVVDKTNQEPKIVEISYGFSHTAQMNLGGYWTLQGEWKEEPLNAPIEIISNLIEIYKKRNRVY